MQILLDACYVPAEPEQSASYRWLGLLIAVTVMVAPWMLALMFVAPAARAREAIGGARF
jgi:hypothetical protein